MDDRRERDFFVQNLDESGHALGVPICTGYAKRAGVITTWYSYDAMNRLSAVATGSYGQVQTGINSDGMPIYSPASLDRDHAIPLDVRHYDGLARRTVSSAASHKIESISA